MGYVTLAFLFSHNAQSPAELKDDAEGVFDDYADLHGMPGDSWYHHAGALSKSGLMTDGDKNNPLPESIRTSKDPYTALVDMSINNAFRRLAIEPPADTSQATAHFSRQYIPTMTALLQSAINALQTDTETPFLNLNTLKWTLNDFQAAAESGSFFPFSTDIDFPLLTWPYICWDSYLEPLDRIHDANAAIGLASFHC